MDIFRIYDDINSLEDIKKYIVASKDGETCFLELKETPQNFCDQGNRQEAASFKLDIAKEISAFSNTAGGIIIVGVAYVNGSLCTTNESRNLYDWIDENASSFIEPINSGMKFKSCDTTAGQFVVMLVPAGRDIPYRVCSAKYADGAKKKDVIRQYYQRIGTNSEPIPEPIVRYMYKSASRQINFKAYSDIKYIGKGNDGLRNIIDLCQLVQPDEVRFVDGWSYYVDSEVLLLSDVGQVLNNDRVYFDNLSIGSIRALPPSKKEIVMNALEIRSAIDEKCFMNNLDIVSGQTETISLKEFLDIYGVYVETRYAADGLPLTLDKRLFVVGKNKDVGRVAMKEVFVEQIDCDNDIKIMAYKNLTDVDIDFVGKTLTNIASMDKHLVL